MKIVLVCLVAVSATLVSAIDGPGSPRDEYGPDYGYAPRGGYKPRGPAYRGGPRGYGRPAYYGPEDAEQPLDIIDKLYKRVDTVQNEVKTTSEILANLEARQSLQKTTLEQLTLETFKDLEETDKQQLRKIIGLEGDVDLLMDELNTLEMQVVALTMLNENVTSTRVELREAIANRTRIEVEQMREIASISRAVNDFKSKLFDVIDNEFDLVNDQVMRSANNLGINENKELDRMCETGQVTLDADDRKAEYLFQTTFSSVPQVLYSVCGYNFNLDALKGVSYDNYYKEPNAVGVSVTADASKTGVTFEVFDKSFGDTALLSADVCFQACNISPGRQASAEGIGFYLGEA